MNAEQEHLSGLLEELAASSFEGVQGAVALQGKRQEAKDDAAIMFLGTHGNEPVGLWVYEYAQENKDAIEDKLGGTVVLVGGNIEAMRKFVKAATPEEKRKARCSGTDEITGIAGIDLNRLPKNLAEMDYNSKEPYEITRAREILNLRDRVNAILIADFHSTSLPIPTQDGGLLFDANGSREAVDFLADGIPLESRIVDAPEALRGWPLASFFGGGDVPAVAIECGSHEDPHTAIKASTIFTSMLARKNMLAVDRTTRIGCEQRMYQMLSPGIVFPRNLGYEFTQIFANFEPIAARQTLACGDGPDILAPDELTYAFGSFGKLGIHDPDFPDDEQLFLLRQLESRHRALAVAGPGSF